MYLYQILYYPTQRYHWIQCEDMDMLIRICISRFGYGWYDYNTQMYEPQFSIHRIMRA